ncbi:MAG TPA: TatD family hydrolase [Steroidobacteraceae bacterium]|nr:TatD family hydrolase [Steroidobacteraceae bacterium]
MNPASPAPPLIDIGVNLTHQSFDTDRDQVLARAARAGVVQMIVTGASVASTRQALALAALHPGQLYATAGIHPHHASELDGLRAEELGELALAESIVAIGECGLDYFRDLSPREAQRRAFAQQLELAARLGKPVFLHQRDAHEDFAAILRDHIRALAGGVAHCFTGGSGELETYLELGLAIGITGWICDERRGKHLIDLVRAIPPERLVLETDAPYLLPRDLAPPPVSRRNEPAFLPHVAATVARARAVPLGVLAAQSTAATRRLFGLADPPGATLVAE